jgi:putative NADH-flavin reductase
MKKVLVVGASGATGKLLVAALIDRGVEITAVVRAGSSLKQRFSSYSQYHEVVANISEIPDGELLPLVQDCDVVLSCLGHNLSFKGLFGKPRRLVADTIKKLARGIAARTSEKKVRIILMNTTGNSNRDIPEKPPLSQRFVIAILRVLLPPHADNEAAADFLRTQFGQDHRLIEWVAIRPDSLIDEVEVSEYELHESPNRNAIFDSAETSRINVADFMADLAIDSTLWISWKGKMPVIYNKQQAT